MKLFINKNTSEVIGTVDGFNDENSKGVMLIPGGLTENDILVEDIPLGHPKEELARRLLDPHDDLRIQFLTHDDKEGVIELPAEAKLEVIETEVTQQQQAEAVMAKRAAQPSLVEELASKVADLESTVASLEAVVESTSPPLTK